MSIQSCNNKMSCCNWYCTVFFLLFLTRLLWKHFVFGFIDIGEIHPNMKFLPFSFQLYIGEGSGDTRQFPAFTERNNSPQCCQSGTAGFHTSVYHWLLPLWDGFCSTTNSKRRKNNNWTIFLERIVRQTSTRGSAWPGGVALLCCI